jgi:NAD(P)-dependent dehydrogenase (short-subunit alcohol dehydrogenase family)
MNQLSGQVALVTGASSGLGAHFAKVLASQGAAVALAARRLERVETLAAEIRAAGGRAIGLALDVAEPKTFAAAFDRIEAELGPLNILVNNAGVAGEGHSLELSVETWDQTFDVNVRGTFFAAQEAARRMIASGAAQREQARIINIASIASQTVLPGLAAYCTSKAAVAMLTRALAKDLARRGVTVNAICPGYIETDFNAEWFRSDGGRKQISRFPRQRLMEAGDLDAALLMLAGPAGARISGSLFTLDDGQSL